MRFCLVLALTVRLFAGSFDELIPSTPEEILSLSNDLLVDGFVSASSGQISLCETDLHVKGAQDLFLKRTYIPPQILGRYEDKDHDNDCFDRFNLGSALNQLKTKGWVVHPHLYICRNQNSRCFQVRDPQGFVLEFQIRENKGILKNSSYGCSNLRGGEASSAADVRNITFSIEKALLHKSSCG